MQAQTLVAALQHERGRAFAVAAGQAKVRLAGDPFQRLARDAVVDDVDHAPHGAAAVQQGAWAAQHLDAFDADRVGGDRMVEAQAGRVHGGAAIGQDADAVTVQPADDGPAGVGPEVGAAHTGCARERFAQGRLRAQKQAGARVLGCRRYQVGCAKGVCRDGDFLEGRRCLGERHGAQREDRRAQGTAENMKLHEKLRLIRTRPGRRGAWKPSRLQRREINEAGAGLARRTARPSGRVPRPGTIARRTKER